MDPEGRSGPRIALRMSDLRWTLSLILFVIPLVSRAATSEPDRIAVIVGSNVGSNDDEPLRFAESDAGNGAAGTRTQNQQIMSLLL